MKQIWGIILTAVLLAVGVTVPAQADANDFRITNFEVDYYLGKDSDGRSTLKTVEKVTAEFPQRDQNHGIERALPRSYDGHSTSLSVQSVTDASGTGLSYVSYENNDHEVLQIGDAKRYVHGSVTYVITYTQRDVTKNFGNKDEFYWDVNGTQWRQPFDTVTARVHLLGDLTKSLNGDTACYQGASGSTERCVLTFSGTALSTHAVNLGVGENVTVALGFAPDTFTSYQPSLWEKVVDFWWVLLLGTAIISFVIIFWLLSRYGKWNNRTKDVGTIVPEYIPPQGVSVLLAESIGSKTRAGVTAQILDLAVRHYLKIYQTREKSMLNVAQYELEIVKSIDDLTQEEKELIATLFGADNVTPGSRLAMKKMKNDYTIAVKMRQNTHAMEGRIRGEYGLRGKDARKSRWFKRMAIILLVIAIVTLSPFLLVVASVAFLCALRLAPLTDKGLALLRYLDGLSLYIEVAEEERLKMLQSPNGAEKTDVGDVSNPAQLVRLYERVLPYAVLFGKEKEWNKHLGGYYEQGGLQPDWYSGHGAFGAAAFASAMSDFSSSMNSYAAATNSSSSGSSGGGSSGGGGGGGGGGGW